MTNTSYFINIRIHILSNATLPHKLNILPYAQSLFRELYPTDLVQNSKNKILHHIGTQMNVTQLTTNFKKTPLKLLSTTILCTNHIRTFPSDRNLQPIQSVNIPDDIIPQLQQHLSYESPR